MAKDVVSTESRPSHTRLDRKVRSSPVPALPPPTEQHRSDKHRTAPDAQLCAAGEKYQLEFQRIFGINLKAARLKCNLKQSEVAALTGLTQQYLSLIEAGQQNVTIKTMALLAKVVDHNLIHLLQEALGGAPKED
jgi:DNA-binding XRE family transcriptional regulator